MAQHTGKRKLHLPLDDMQICMADAAGSDLYQHFAGLRPRLRDVLCGQMAADFRQDNSFHRIIFLHTRNIVVATGPPPCAAEDAGGGEENQSWQF
jgi:hypothetical protein